MKFSAPNNHNFHEKSPISEVDLKNRFGAKKSLVTKSLFSSVFELTTQSKSLAQLDLFRFKPERNKLEDKKQLILKLYSKEDRQSEKQYFVQTGLFAGLVYYNGCQFSITTRYGRNFLHRMLNYVNDIYVDNQEPLGEQSDDSNEFQHIIAYLFIQSLERSAVLGIPKIYQELSQHGHKVRGKIDINSYLRDNIPFTGKITTSYRAQVYVQEIVDVLYACCLQLESSFGEAIKRKLLGVYQLLKQHYSGRYPENITIQKAKNHSVLHNPMFEGYKKVLSYAEVILKEKSVELDSEQKLTTKGYLFDIAQLFETYLEKLLSRYFKDWYIKGQVVLHVYNPMFYKRKMLPDIIMKHKYTNDIIVLDAKFKNMQFRKEDLDRSDFYQIHSYIQYFQPNVLLGGLIYPLSQNLDAAKAHSSQLFGISTHGNGFIVDGIAVNKDMSMQEIIDSENAFLNRLEDLIGQKQQLRKKQNLVEVS